MRHISNENVTATVDLFRIGIDQPTLSEIRSASQVRAVGINNPTFNQVKAAELLMGESLQKQPGLSDIKAAASLASVGAIDPTLNQFEIVKTLVERGEKDHLTPEMIRSIEQENEYNHLKRTLKIDASSDQIQASLYIKTLGIASATIAQLNKIIELRSVGILTSSLDEINTPPQ
ncbi:MAG: hypothetical protein FJX71_01650 [Alphaproteobacteria bacterium]|nr:hypothetical protein [Alphaproteobacteria bacterium]